jgi:RES domain-containing protein
MEMLVHLGNADVLNLYMSIPIKFDDHLCRRLAPADLPTEWAADPIPMATRAIGAKWIDDESSVILAVPSAIVHIETNFIINPRHRDFGEIVTGSASEFHFDPRLLKTRP